jgi:cold shock CspA family protein
MAPEHPEDPREARYKLPQSQSVYFLYQGWQGRKGLMQGFVKAYDDTTGIGVIVRDDDRSEVLLRPGSLDGSMFRFLRQGQRLRFDIDIQDNRPFAMNLRFGSDGY